MKYFTLWVLLVVHGSLCGSNLHFVSQPKLVSCSDTEATIGFTIRWDNSWNHLLNHDAVYIFGKYCLAGKDKWHHLVLAAEGHEILTADYGWERHAGGIFIRRSTFSVGNSEVEVRFKWNLNGNASQPVSAVDLEAGEVIFSFTGLEMVKIPLSLFYAGEPGASNGFTRPFFGSIPARYDLIGTNSNFAYTASGGTNIALAANRQNNSLSQDQCWRSAVVPSWWQVDFKTAKTIRYFGVSSLFSGNAIPEGTWYLEGCPSNGAAWVELWSGGPDDFSTNFISYPIQKALKVQQPGSYQYYRIRIPGVDAERLPFGQDVLVANVAMTEEELEDHFAGTTLIDGRKEALSAVYPNGYFGMYAMKYELTQEQYVDFLNKQTYSGQFYNTIGGELDRIKKGEYVFGPDPQFSHFRNGIVIDSEITGDGKPGVFACDQNSVSLTNAGDDGHTAACNYLSIESMLAYADWAGLRPLSELEYEKMCRIPYPAYSEAGEYSWNTTTASVASGLLDSGQETEYFSGGNIHAAGSVEGSVRSGIFVRDGTSREQGGVSFWGVEDLSGNLACIYVNTEAAGRSFDGSLQGDGQLDEWGRSDISGNSWPRDPQAYGVRGGDFSASLPEAVTGERSRATGAWFASLQERKPQVGVRLGCNVPYSVVEIKLTLMNGMQSGEQIVYDTVCDAREYSIRGAKNLSPVPVQYSWYISTDLQNWDLLEGESSNLLNLGNLSEQVEGLEKKTVYYRQVSHSPDIRGESGVVGLVIGPGHTINKVTETLQPCMAAEGFTVMNALPTTYTWRCAESGKMITPDQVTATSSIYKLRTADFRKATEQPSGIYMVEIEMRTADKCVKRQNVQVYALPYTSNPFAEEMEEITYSGQTDQRLMRSWGGNDEQQWKIVNEVKGTLDLAASTGVLNNIHTTMVIHIDVQLVCLECPDRVYTKRLEERVRTLSYTGSYHTLNLLPENYKIECAGAQGQNGRDNGNGTTRGGYGAYVTGNLALSATQPFFVYVGGQGSIFNSNTSAVGPYGGGATDFRLEGGTWSVAASLRSRVMVAAGGGGGCSHIASGGGAAANANAGNTGGGGLTAPNSNWNKDGKGATQTAGGACGTAYTDNYWGVAGSFGIGGVAPNNGNAGSGGGGYYGGGSGTAGNGQDGNGGGGSSFISGHPGCNAVNASGAHTGGNLHYSGIRFTNTAMTANNRSGHGYARITVLN